MHADSKAWREKIAEEMAAETEATREETRAIQARTEATRKETRAIKARTAAIREEMGTSHKEIIAEIKP
jgi:hypothetical protein